ncbi:DNA pol B 2 domain-containing protein [Aphis craccivora]|uniref:DNA pol B 2 domain-containing protein n=1 Tax=Aphis craccivora TaxID=307492 RepID=A0A6G0XYX9_APHCR|nr:DNA pol B 2 domain-containing protein [Aphis craccivora]
MASNLADLARNLTTADFCNFHDVEKVFTSTDMPLVTRKCVFPYEYTDSYSKLRAASKEEVLQCVDRDAK